MGRKIRTDLDLVTEEVTVWAERISALYIWEL